MNNNTFNQQSQTKHQIKFTGNAWEYSKIWIVDIILSIATLGIYTAWAKVHRRKYIYQHTSVLRNFFNYHASGLQIFKGRVLLFLAIFLLSIAEVISYTLNLILIILFSLLYPYIKVLALRFRSRVTSYGNLRFHFDGTVQNAYFVYFLYPLCSALILFLNWPFLVRAKKKYEINGISLGGKRFLFDVGIMKIYSCVIKSLFFSIIFIALFFTSGFFLMKSFFDNQEGFKLENLTKSTAEVMEIFRKKGDAFEVGSESEKEQAQKRTSEELNNVQHLSELSSVFYLLLSSVILFYLVYHHMYKALMRNLMFNNTTFSSKHLFESKVSGLALVWIFLSNTFLIIFSIGLLIPFTSIRLQRYLAKKTSFVQIGEIAEFTQSESHTTGALGSEYSEFFDLDFDLPL